MEKILKTKKQIRFQDCDPFNHLNNARYIDYFLNTREDQLAEHYNLSIFESFKASGKSWMVTSNQIAHLKPATTMETVVIESQLIGYSENALLLEMKMWDEQEQTLKAILWTRFKYFDFAAKGVAQHSESLMDLFKAITVLQEKQLFEERCQAVIQELKTSGN